MVIFWWVLFFFFFSTGELGVGWHLSYPDFRELVREVMKDGR